ncbi:MAG TPA: OsmC family protein [Gemmatimonadaceae bacterium]|nr:OsmC family protein [Gemmatimonadaceae bacterium]
MKITLLGDDGVRLEPVLGPMTIEASSADQLYSPFHMLGSSLAFCTYSVLASWASNAKLESSDIVVEVKWKFVEDPHRVGDIAMTIQWPSLPPAREKAAARVADLCAVHATLTHPPAISTTVETKAAVHA